MEYRQNDATINRPEGSRPIDAPCVFTDLVATVEQLRNEKAWDTNDLNGITVYKTDTVAMVVTLLKVGTKVRKNSTDMPMSLLVLSGEVLVKTDDDVFTLRPANLLNLHPRICHDLEAKKETVLLQMTHS
jgi:hypothetical protein